MRFREAVLKTSALADAYRPGLQALKAADLDRIECEDTYILTGSVDVDSTLRRDLPHAPRWDYAVGLKHTTYDDTVTWIEVHPASSTHGVKEILAKLAWLNIWTADFAPDLKRITRAYVWVATGKVTFPANSPERRRIAAAGITWAGRRYKLIRESE